MTSCLARNDYNVAFSIIILMVLINFYNQNPKATTKIIIQILIILTLADIIWIYLFSSAWEHGDGTNDKTKSSKIDNQFWDSLWFIHKIVYVFAYIELNLKGFLIYYLIADFKEKYKLKDLFDFNYDDGRNSIQPQNQAEQLNGNNSMNNYVNESKYSYAEDFQNNY